MAVSTQLLDTQSELVPLRWGFWHIARLFDAMCIELGFEQDSPEADSLSFWPESFTFEQRHRFVDESDGEVFDIFPGYTYRAFR